MRTPLVLLLSLLALSAACGDAEEQLAPEATPSSGADPATAASSVTPAPTPSTPALTPVPGATLWRWVNVTVVVPEGSNVTIGRGTVPTEIRPAGGPGMDLTIHHEGDIDKVSYIVIDAVTGQVLDEQMAQGDRAAIDEVLRTLSLLPFDAAVKGWPYQAEFPADAQRRNWGGISYVVPDPASGVKVDEWIGDPNGPFINISNGRSTILISHDTQTGVLSQQTIAVSPQDKAPFDRYFSSAQLCERDVGC